MDTFKPGDVVQLKSGGPRMTVYSVAASGTYLCNWFNREGDVWTPQHASFRAEQLGAARGGGEHDLLSDETRHMAAQMPGLNS